MKLTEVLNTPTSYRWTKQDADQWRAQFVVDGFSYQVMIAKDPGRGNKPGNWYVELIDGGTTSPELGQEEPPYSVTPTGRSASFKVLATAVAIVDEFLDVVKPNTIEVQGPQAGTSKSVMSVIHKLVDKYAGKGYYGSSNKWNFGDPTQRTTFRTRTSDPQLRPKPIKANPKSSLKFNFGNE